MAEKTVQQAQTDIASELTSEFEDYDTFRTRVLRDHGVNARDALLRVISQGGEAEMKLTKNADGKLVPIIRRKEGA